MSFRLDWEVVADVHPRGLPSFTNQNWWVHHRGECICSRFVESQLGFGWLATCGLTTMDWTKKMVSFDDEVRRLSCRATS